MEVLPMPNPSVSTVRAKSSQSECELMRELALREAERCFEVFCEVFGLLDGSNDGRVDRALVSGLVLW